MKTFHIEMASRNGGRLTLEYRRDGFVAEMTWPNLPTEVNATEIRITSPTVEGAIESMDAALRHDWAKEPSIG